MQQNDPYQSIQTNNVIYLTCLKDICQDEGIHLSNYKHIVAKETPRSIKRIDVIANPDFSKHN